MSQLDLTGRLAVVTGCRRGIGMAMAEALAMAGADIIGRQRVAGGQRQEVAERVERHGRSFVP